MAITSPGIGSGLDVNGIVSQLMSIERQPLNKLDIKEAGYQASISAIGSLKGTLSSFQSAVTTLTRAATFASSTKASSSDATVATASATNSATLGTYSLSVTSLAQAQKLRTSQTYSSVDAAVGGGTITIQFGTTTPDPAETDPDNPTLAGTFNVNGAKATATINIDPAKSTLLDVRNAINSAKAGVTASIVNDGTGYRLAISSDDTGAANSLKITVSEPAGGDNTDQIGLSALTFDPAANTRNLKISQAARDALLSIDGIPIVKSSNSISDAIDGVTFSLLKTGTTSINVNQDKSGISTAIQAFAKAYNDANKALRDLTGYDPETKKAGALQGDATARSVLGQLRSVMAGELKLSAGGISNLSQIGISFDRKGVMTVDQAKLNAAINDPNKDVGTVFTGIAKSSDRQINVLSSVSKPEPGKYPVTISQLATQSSANAVLSSKTVAAGTSFGLSIDDVAATFTLDAGTYTGDSLAAQLQSKINGISAFKSAGVSVTVQYNATDDSVTITSGKYGTASSVTGIASSLVTSSSNTPGKDVAGSIGGLAATGSGQILTGDGSAKNLRLQVTGGSLGDRGMIIFENGIAEKLSTLIDGFVSSKGTLSSKTTGIQASIDTIEQRREVFQRRLVQIETRYRRQFSNLDTLMSQMTATQNALTQQLAGLTQKAS